MGAIGLFLGVVGAGVGYIVSGGNPMGAQIGFAIGSGIGNIVDPAVYDGPALNDSTTQTSRAGIPIPIGWGIVHVAGNIIQMTPKVYFDVKTGSKKQKTIEHHVKRSFAIGIARGPEGPITGLLRCWENNKLIYDARAGSAFPAADNAAFEAATTLYLGTEDQDPDPTLEADKGVGNQPAYRGLPYIVWDNYDLTKFGGSIPTYRFETYTAGLDPYLFQDTFTDADSTDLASGHTANIDINPTADGYGVSGTGSEIIDGKLRGKDVTINNAWVNVEYTSIGRAHLEIDALEVSVEEQGIWFRAVYNYTGGWPNTAATDGFLIGIDDIGVTPSLGIYYWNNPASNMVLLAQTSMAAEGSIEGLSCVLEAWGDVNHVYGSCVVNGNEYNVQVTTTNNNASCIYGTRVAGDAPADNFYVLYPSAAESVVYSPQMMTFNGASYYRNVGYNAHAYTGGTYTGDIICEQFTGAEQILIDNWSNTGFSKSKVQISLGSSDAAEETERKKLIATGWDENGVLNFRIISETEVVDGTRHAFHFTHDQKYEWMRLAIDGRREDQTGDTRLEISDTTWATGTYKCFVGAGADPSGNPFRYFIGKMGWVTVSHTVTDYEYFFVNNQPKEINESLWLEFRGHSPSWFNAEGTMTDNHGDATFGPPVDMLEVGTISGPDSYDALPDAAVNYNVGTSGGIYLGDIVSDICGYVDVVPDTDAIALIDVRGFLVGGTYNAADTIRTLQRAYFFDLVEIDGELIAILRGGSSVATIMRTDMVRSSEALFETTREQGVEFPKKLHVAYTNQESDYTPNKQTSPHRSSDVKSLLEVSFDLPINLVDADAAQIADKLHKVAWVEQQGPVRFAVSEKFAYLTPSDIISVEASSGVLKRVRIQKITFVDGMLQIESVLDRASAYASSVVAAIPTTPIAPGTNLPGDTIYEIMDLPVLRQDQDTLHVYVAAYGSGLWGGAIIEQLVDTEWVFRGRANYPTTMGTIAEELPTHAVGIDETNTLLVSVSDDATVSITQTEFDLGGNLALVGDELIQFRDVVQEGSDYRISYLNRGALNTDPATNAIGARFVCLVSPTVVTLTKNDIGTTPTFRVYSAGNAPVIADQDIVGVDTTGAVSWESVFGQKFTETNFFTAKVSVPTDGLSIAFTVPIGSSSFVLGFVSVETTSSAGSRFGTLSTTVKDWGAAESHTWGLGGGVAAVYDRADPGLSVVPGGTYFFNIKFSGGEAGITTINVYRT